MVAEVTLPRIGAPAADSGIRLAASHDDRSGRSSSGSGSARGSDSALAAKRNALAATFPFLFDELDSDAVSQIARRARIVRFNRGNVLSGPPAAVCFLMSGTVLWSIPSAVGRHDLMLDVLHAGDVLGDGDLFATTPVPSRARARTAGEAMAVSPDDLRKVLLRHPQLSLRWLELSARRLQRMQQLAADAVFLDIAGRLYRRLLEICNVDPASVTSGCRLEHGLRQRDLAALVGASRESLNKLLGVWKREGIVSVGRGYLVVNRARELARAASWGE